MFNKELNIVEKFLNILILFLMQLGQTCLYWNITEHIFFNSTSKRVELEVEVVCIP